MKIKQLLETAEHEIAIQHIAPMLLSVIKHAVRSEERRQDSLSDDDDLDVSGELELGRISDLIDTTDIPQEIHSALDLKLKVHISPKLAGDGRYYGEYLPNQKGGVLTIYYPLYNLKQPIKYRVNDETVLSYIVHELRHHVDDVLSYGWAFVHPPGMVYHRRPHEINARLSQVKHDLRQWSKRLTEKPSREDIVEKIHDLFDKWNLVDVFEFPKDNKRFRQLLKRTLKYAETL